MSQATVSFVKEKQLHVIEQIEELKERIDQCRKSHTPLSGVDLSRVDLQNIDMEQLEITDVIFNRYDIQTPLPKTIYNLSFRGSTLTRVSFANCHLIRCNFDRFEQTKRESAKQTGNNAVKEATEEEEVIIDTTLYEVDFFMSHWEACRLRKTRIEIADFRYSEFMDCSLGGCHITLGDFYMTAFRGTTNFMGSNFIHCSITNATFEHDCIRIKGIQGLAQESYEDYSSIIIGHQRWRKQNPCATYSHQNEGEDKGERMKSKSFTHREASVVYAHLSGFYAGKGLFKDSNMAYERAKRNEARSAYYAMRWQWQQLLGKRSKSEQAVPRRGILLQNMGRELLRVLNFCLCWVLGFGYKLTNVITCFILLVVGYSILFHWKTAEVLPWHTELAYSLNNSIGSFDLFINVLGAWMSSLQTTVGVLIVGFAGFVIANRVRNNY